MSLLPHILDGYPNFFRPSRIVDQHFGLALIPEDFLQPLTIPRVLLRSPAGYMRNWKSYASERDCGSTITCDREKFQANLDVQQFRPEEIAVKISGDNMITVEGKHEEKQDEHGYIYRHFVRRYVVPRNCDMNRVESKLSSDGILMITAPKILEDETRHRNIPINQTGEAARAAERKSDGDK